MAETQLPSTDVILGGKHRIRMAIDHSGSRDLLIFQKWSLDGHTFLGQFVRVWDADGRLSGDRPTCGPDNFIVDEVGKIDLP